MFFDNSRPDRKRRARVKPSLERSAIPDAKTYELIWPHEILDTNSQTAIYDVECYINYFLVSFKFLETGKVIYFETENSSALQPWSINGLPCDFVYFRDNLSFILHRFCCVGFNSISYDLPMCGHAMQGLLAEVLKQKSDSIIKFGERADFNFNLANVNHVDLIEVAPLDASLKLYGGRLHCERMQDLPFDEDAVLNPEQKAQVRDYNINDLDVTELLYNHLKPQIDIREFLGQKYNADWRSKSDAQVGEQIVLAELRQRGVQPKKPDFQPGSRFRFQMFDNMQFMTPQLRQLKEIVGNTSFEVAETGHVKLPSELEGYRITHDQQVYRIGVGGLHSSEKEISYWTHGSDRLLIDRDVQSYYPRIIINQGLYPPGLSFQFVPCFSSVVETRLQAKAANNKKLSEGLKIGINGCFGKYGNIYSLLYSSSLVTQVTLSGQLYLLMLVEAFREAGFNVISANTDGVVCQISEASYSDFLRVVQWWEEATSFVTEEVRYTSIHSRDVNNYIAVKEDKTCKTKGIYSEVGSALNSPLSKNPESLIISDAIQARITRAIPIEQTIYDTKDVRRFVNVRTVKGGAYKDNTYLGKAIRWYYAKDEKGTINRVLTGHVVPKTEGARPCMILPTGIPADLDREYYLKETNDALYDLGIKRRPTVGSLI